MRSFIRKGGAITTLPILHELDQRGVRIRSGACTCTLDINGDRRREHVYPPCRKHPKSPAWS